MQSLVLLTLAAAPLSFEPALVGSVAPIPELAFVLQSTAIGTALGSAVALRAKRRNPEADSWSITTAWASLGFLLGGIAALLALVG